MFKRFVCTFLCVLLCVSCCPWGVNATESTTSDGGDHPAYKEVPLTDEELFILEAMGSDVHVVSDENYVETVSELIYHASEFSGTVYQLEGLYSLEGDTATVYRILVSDEHSLILGVPLRYVNKEIEDGAWVRVTGIVAVDEAEDGTSSMVFDVVAIEALPAFGQTTFQWDGSSVHQH